MILASDGNMPQSLEEQEARARRGFMSIKGMLDTAPDAGVLSVLCHNQKRTETTFRRDTGSAGAERA